MSTTYKIIHTVPAITEESSGPSYSVTRLCESLIKEGEDVVLAALDWQEIQSAPKYLKTFPLSFGSRRLGSSKLMKQWFYDQVHSHDLRVIHSHGMWQMNSLYPGWAAKKAGVNFVVSPRGAFSEWSMAHGSKLKKVFWPFLQKPVLESTTCFHATAESEYEDIRRLGFKQPVAIIPNGIDIPKPNLETQSGKLTLLFLGRLHPKKGLDILLSSWQIIQDRYPDWRLVIVGSDVDYYGASGYLNKLQNDVQKLGLERITFLGELHGLDKLRAYQEADVFVLPTYSENFGMTVTEALSAGTPAIVSTGAPWERLNAKKAGWSIDIGLEPLVDCLQYVLSKPREELLQIGTNGRNWMRQEFSWELVGKRMKNTYDWLYKRSSSVPSWVYKE